MGDETSKLQSGMAPGAACSYPETSKPWRFGPQVGSLGTWKPLVDFCHFLLLPAVGITEILVLGQW